MLQAVLELPELLSSRLHNFTQLSCIGDETLPSNQLRKGLYCIKMTNN